MYLCRKELNITTKTIDIEAFRSHFQSQTTFGIKDILSFYRQYEKEINRSTVDWRIYDLKQLGIIHRVGRGTYSIKAPIYLSLIHI